MDFSGFPLTHVGEGTGWLLFLGVIIALFRGRIWTDAAYQQKVHEANEWRTESRIKDQQLLEKDIQLRHMEEVGKTVNAIMGSMQRHKNRAAGRAADDEGGL